MPSLNLSPVRDDGASEERDLLIMKREKKIELDDIAATIFPVSTKVQLYADERGMFFVLLCIMISPSDLSLSISFLPPKYCILFVENTESLDPVSLRPKNESMVVPALNITAPLFSLTSSGSQYRRPKSLPQS